MQPAETCIYYPVKSYLLVLKSLSGKAIRFSTLDCNETETFLNGLEDNKMYTYSVTAINTRGMLQLIQKKFFVSLTIMIGVIATCHLICKFLATSDVQNVTAIEIDEYTVEVHCYFINGSDAQGCLSSNLIHVKSKSIELILMENDSMAWSVANLAHPISCYHQAFAFDIETGGNISDLAIEGCVVINQSQAVCPVVTQGTTTLIILNGIIYFYFLHTLQPLSFPLLFPV